MKAEDKIEFIKKIIIEESKINAENFFFVEFVPVIDLEATGGVPDNAPEIISKEEQAKIIKKLEKEGFLEFSDTQKNNNGAWVVLNNSIRKQEENNAKSISLKNGILSVNKETGVIKLNEVEHEFNPNSEEFRVIYLLFSNNDNRATYKQILGENNSKDKRRQLGFKIRDIKKYLGILPKSKSKNKNIISSIKGYGYKLIK